MAGVSAAVACACAELPPLTEVAEAEEVKNLYLAPERKFRTFTQRDV